MSTTQPIKDTKELEKLENYYLKTEPNLRNYALIIAGLNTALRISDTVSLRWRDVYDFKNERFFSHIIIREKKTKKETKIAINESLKNALELYKASLKKLKPDNFVFHGRQVYVPLSRAQAYRIIHKVGEELDFSQPISCHSLRKTFGYYALNSGTNPSVLMVIFNHSSFNITKRYLGIEQEDKDEVFLNINL